jgi:hypothetical protein
LKCQTSSYGGSISFKFWSSPALTGAKGLSGGLKMRVVQYVVAVKIKEKNILYFI